MGLCLFIYFQFFGTSNVSHRLVALRIHVVYMIEDYNLPVQKCNLSDPRRALAQNKEQCSLFCGASVRALFGDIIHLKFLSPRTFFLNDI
jgi:hypothetical protein